MTLDAKTRNRLLRRVLAPLTVLVIYALLVAPGPAERMREARDAVAALTRNGTVPAALAGARQQVDSLTRERQDLERRVADRRTAYRAALAFRDKPDYPNRVVTRVVRVLEANALTVLETRRDDSLARELVPRGFRQMTDRVDGEDRAPDGGWYLAFTGRYADVVEALNALAADDLPSIPFGLVLETDRPDNTLRWSLMLWI